MRVPLLAAGLGAAALLAGCAGSGSSGTGSAAAASTPVTGTASSGAASASPSPSATASGLADAAGERVLTAAQKAFVSASSVRLKGTVADAGQTLGLDLRIKRGAGATGTLTLGGKSVEILRIGDVAYVRGSSAFYAGLMDAATAKALAGKWLRMSSSQKDFSSLLGLTDLQTFAKGVFTPHGAVAKGAVTTVDGRRVVELRDDNGSALDVALDGPAYPLRVTGPKSSAGQVLTFTAYNAPVPLAPPPASQVVAIPGS